MATDFDKAARTLLNGQTAQKLSGKRAEIEKLANSDDGKKVQALLNKNGGLSSALESGDMAALKNAVSGILKTDAGANLARQLTEMMKK